MSYSDVATPPDAWLFSPVVKPAANPTRRRSRLVIERASTTPFERRLAAAETIVAPSGNRHRAYLLGKRVTDVIGALCLFVLLAPVLLTTLVVLTITTKGRPLFSQPRAGYLGRPFRMWKFRTMRLDADRMQHTVANEISGPVFKNRRDPRITRIGRWLRKTSIDEMPQLFHVLTGHMSLVGPRPLPIREIAQCDSWHRMRLGVVPSLTCLWQVSGRSEIGFDDWVRMDVRYIRTQSVRTDMALLWRTPWTVITGRGAY